MPRVGSEPTTPVFERARTVHALDRAATVIGLQEVHSQKFHVHFLSLPLATRPSHRTLPHFTAPNTIRGPT
jgi:hypothetical protein